MKDLNKKTNRALFDLNLREAGKNGKGKFECNDRRDEANRKELSMKI